VRAQGALRQAVNRYRAVYGFVPGALSNLEQPKISDAQIPNGEEAVATAALAA